MPQLALRRAATAIATLVLIAMGIGRAPAAEPIHLTLALPVICFCAAPVYTADKLGYFKDEGLDVEIATLNGSGAMFAAIASGSASFGLTNGMTLLSSVSKGLSMVAFVGMDHGLGGFNMVVSTAYAQQHGIVERQDYRVAMRKLAGARIGVVGTTTTGGLLLTGVARQIGLPDDALKLIAMTPPAANAALLHGEIDAWWQPAVGVGGVVAFRSANLPQIKDTVGNVLFTTRDYVAKNPDVVSRMARAIARGDNALLDPKTQSRALESVYERMPNLPRDEVKAEVLDPTAETLVSNGKLTVSAFDVTNRVGTQFGLVPQLLTPEQLRSVYTLDFVPKRYIRP
jgi:NitT/TauT family transport system substrate-binding protein